MKSQTADVGGDSPKPAADAAGHDVHARGGGEPGRAVGVHTAGEGAGDMTEGIQVGASAPHRVGHHDAGNPTRLTQWRSALRRVVDRESQAPDRSGLSENPDKLRYLQSWMLLRFLIGVLGLMLVLVTWLGSALLPDGQWALRGSLSAYYYSGMREFFTCTLAA